MSNKLDMTDAEYYKNIVFKIIEARVLFSGNGEDTLISVIDKLTENKRVVDDLLRHLEEDSQPQTRDVSESDNIPHRELKVGDIVDILAGVKGRDGKVVSIDNFGRIYLRNYPFSFLSSEVKLIE